MSEKDMYIDSTQAYWNVKQDPAGQPPQSADDRQIGGTHYRDMPVQPWTVMEAVLTHAEFVGFLKGNVIKYSMRAGRKAGSDDAAKAEHYLQKLREMNIQW